MRYPNYCAFSPDQVSVFPFIHPELHIYCLVWLTFWHHLFFSFYFLLISFLVGAIFGWVSLIPCSVLVIPGVFLYLPLVNLISCQHLGFYGDYVTNSLRFSLLFLVCCFRTHFDTRASFIPLLLPLCAIAIYYFAPHPLCHTVHWSLYADV